MCMVQGTSSRWRSRGEPALLRAALGHLLGEQRALVRRGLHRAQGLHRLLQLGGQRRALLRGELAHALGDVSR